jgi:hypothetical protein
MKSHPLFYGYQKTLCEERFPILKVIIRLLSILLVIYVLMSSGFAVPTFAKTSRFAVITDVSGNVTVTKGGGFNPIPAFVNMPLNEGDSIYTGDDGSATLELADPESKRVIGANSNVTISEMREEASSKIERGSSF